MSTLDRILDEGVAQGDAQRRLSEAQLQEVFQREVASVLDPLAGMALVTIKEIRQHNLVVSRVLTKVLKGPYKKDPEVGRLYDTLERYLKNATTLQTGLDEYKRIGPRDLLNRQGNFNVNAARNIVGEIGGYFQCARGLTRGSGGGGGGAIEDALKHLEARLAYLQELRASQPQPPQEPGGVSIVAPEKPTKAVGIVVRSEINVREP